MDPILASASKLDVALLETDEEEYEETALKVVSALRKAQLPDFNTLQQVCIRFPARAKH